MNLKMSEENMQEVVEEVDSLLQEALKHANRYSQHKETRLSAHMAFENIENARIKLDKLDKREFDDN